MYNEVDYDKKLGIYKPSFFYIELDVGTEFADILKNTSSLSVFFHEYIHFLQDILTINGINNTRSIFLLLQNAISFMQQSKNGIKSLPHYFPSKNKIDYKSIIQYTYGNNDKNIFKMLNNSSKIIKITPEKNILYNKPIMTYYITFDNIQFKYQLGTRDIKEGMAFFLQEWVFGKDIPIPPIFPYKTIEMLVNYFSPNSFPEKIYLIALCELSLTCANPMMFFIETLEVFSQEGYVPNNINDFEKKVMLGRKIDCNDIIYDDCKVLYNYLVDELINQYKVLLNNDLFSDTISWLNILLENSKHIIYNKTLPITMLFISDGKKYFQQTVTDILGSPIIYLKGKRRGHFFDVHGASGNLYFLRVLERFMHSLYYGTSCWLDEYCKEICTSLQIDDYTDDNCRKYPTRRIRPNANCPFVYICDLFGLPEDVEFSKYSEKPNFA